MNEHQVYATVALKEMLNKQERRTLTIAMFSNEMSSDSTGEALERAIEEKRRIDAAIEWVKRQTGE